MSQNNTNQIRKEYILLAFFIITKLGNFGIIFVMFREIILNT